MDVVVIAYSPHSAQLRHGGKSIGGQGNVLYRLEERLNESVGLRARHDEIELVKLSTEPLVKEKGNVGRSMGGLVDQEMCRWA